MHMTALVCPTHSNAGAGHDNNFPLCTFMLLVNHILKMVDKLECDGRNGRVDRYVCGVLIDIGVRKVMMKRQTSRIFSISVQFTSYRQISIIVQPKLIANWSCAHHDPGYQSSEAWSTNRDHPHNTQYFTQK